MTSWLGLTVRPKSIGIASIRVLSSSAGRFVESVLRPQVFWLPLIVPLLLGFRRDAKGPNRAADWIILGARRGSGGRGAARSTAGGARVLLLAPAAAMIATRGRIDRMRYPPSAQ